MKTIRNFYSFFFLILCFTLFSMHANADSKSHSIVKNSFILPEIKTNNQDIYHIIDSNKLENRLLFYSSINNLSNDSLSQDVIYYQNFEMRSFNKYLYLFFYMYLLLLMLFSRFFPYQFKLQLFGFFNRSDQREMLAGSTGWIEGEKIFPLLVTLLFIATWIIQPLLNLWVFDNAHFTIVLVSFFILMIVFLLNRLFQIIFSHVLAFEYAMEYFTKSSFNSLFVLAILGFPLFTIFHSILPNEYFISPYNTLLIIAMLYITRSIKSILTCLRFELRQIIYLIIYLCAFEIPILIIGLKWISEKVII